MKKGHTVLMSYTVEAPLMDWLHFWIICISFDVLKNNDPKIEKML